MQKNKIPWRKFPFSTTESVILLMRFLTLLCSAIGFSLSDQEFYFLRHILHHSPSVIYFISQGLSFFPYALLGQGCSRIVSSMTFSVRGLAGYVAEWHSALRMFYWFLQILPFTFPAYKFIRFYFGNPILIKFNYWFKPVGVRWLSIRLVNVHIQIFFFFNFLTKMLFKSSLYLISLGLLK